MADPAEEIKRLQRENGEIRRQTQKLEELRREAQELRQTLGTSFSAFLKACHQHYHIPLRPETRSTWQTKGLTRPKKKYIPTRLAPWDGFLQCHQEAFRSADTALASISEEYRHQFDAPIAIQTVAANHCPKRITNEFSFRFHQTIAIECPVEKIIARLSKDPQVSTLFGLADGLDFENARNSLSDNNSEVQYHLQRLPHTPPSGGQMPALATSDSDQGLQKDRTQAVQSFVHKKNGGARHLLFVVEYNPPHKLTTDLLKAGLREMDLATEVFGRVDIPEKVHDSDSTNTSGKQRPRKKRKVWASNKDKSAAAEARFQYDADQMMAAVMTQTFHYMIEEGLPYSYITTGQAFVFLHIRQDDPTTLFYHLSIPSQETSDIPIEETAVGQVLGLALIAFKEAGPRSQAWRQNAMSNLPKHLMNSFDDVLLQGVEASAEKPTPLASESKSKARRNLVSGDYHTPNTPRDDFDDEDGSPLRRKAVASSCKHLDGVSKHMENTSVSQRSPTLKSGQQQRDFCTQKCLLGITRRRPLDVNCPNIEAHRSWTISQYSKPSFQQLHAITGAEFPELVRAQLAQDLDVNCKPMGIQGARGALFRITLESHGYTFVAKGTVYAFIPQLLHEAKVYQRLKRLQGRAVPVYLGNINLVQKYYLTLGVRIRHMMLLSWGGELSGYNDEEKPTDSVGRMIRREAFRTLREIEDEGVDQRDFRPPNLLWNAEVQRVMVIDFERAVIEDATPCKEDTERSVIDDATACKEDTKRAAVKRSAEEFQQEDGDDLVRTKVLQELSPNKRIRGAV
ncbi:MAG: hypothetical protein Q9171_004500 [Xanthocarpia ochracea]